MMADEVNQYAAEGGDTEPETAKAIKARNEALQAHKDELADIAQTVVEAQVAAQESVAKAEAALAETNFDLTTGTPVGAAEPPKPASVEKAAKAKA